MHPILKDAGWCIYGIIYHYVPFLLSNPIVKFSGPNSMIPKSITNFEGGLFSSSVWQSMAAIRRPGQDPNHLVLQELGWQFFQDHSKGHSQRLFIIQSAVKAASTSILLGQLNWSIQEAINHACMSLTQLGQFIFHCGNSITQFNSKDGQSCIDPIKTIKPDDSPSRISLSVLLIYWPPFITWGLSPQLINILDLFLSLLK
ncbi:hypothetical protein O181_089684 [Austropuccinia psidii MF-1]|uniref:Uncharacterized protein n=1 Tax=Austropuccinia psidii MF-1 TaxID=1389203 RepID=A0A9Q3IU36_9BASI|nr:hypothetical protein [Austropuccinia psidii MF-1]